MRSDKFEIVPDNFGFGVKLGKPLVKRRNGFVLRRIGKGPQRNGDENGKNLFGFIPVESVCLDFLYLAKDRDAFQIPAPVECLLFYRSDACGDRDRGDGSAVKRPFTDNRGAVGDHDLFLSAVVLQQPPIDHDEIGQRSFLTTLGVYGRNSLHIQRSRFRLSYPPFSQLCTVLESRSADLRRLRYGKIDQLTAVSKGIAADFLNGRGEYGSLQFSKAGKCVVRNLLRPWELIVISAASRAGGFNFVTAQKCVPADLRNTGRDRDRGQGTITKGGFSHRSQPRRQRQVQFFASGKCSGANARHTVRDRNARQAAAFPKRPLPNARHTVREPDAGQFFTFVKRPAPDARHTVRKRNASQLSAFLKRPIPDARHAIWYHDLRYAALLGVLLQNTVFDLKSHDVPFLYFVFL